MSHSCRLSRRSWRRGFAIPEVKHYACIARDQISGESGGPSGPSPEEIAKLAYSYWEARGRAGGSAVDDWLRAERELGGA